MMAARRRLWLAGWPSEQLVIGCPAGEHYTVGHFGIHRRDRKNTVSAGRTAR